MTEENKQKYEKGFFRNNFFQEGITTLLIFAVYLERREMVEIILKRMDQMDKKVSDGGGSAINYAIRNKDIEMAMILLRHNAVELNDVRQDTWESGLIELVKRNDLGMYELLRTHINDIDEQDSKGYTALMIACMKGNVEMVRKLLFDCARTSYCCNKGKTALDYARVGGNKQIIKMIEESM